MGRTLSACALLLAVTSYAWSADARPPDMVIRMTVRPMPAPKPALKYQLLPELREMNPGNPIHEYTRCFAEQHNFWRTKESQNNREKWQTMPLRDLPVQEIRPWYNQERGSLRYADAAARLDKPDWQILLRLKREGVNLLLPDVQGLRELAGALKVRFRVEIAENHFDDAVATAKTMLALSRHFGEHPTLIGDLVGIAIATIALGTVDEMIQQPGCPNLFWALTDLPSPFIDIRKGLQGERLWVDVELAGLDKQEAMTEGQLRKVVNRLVLLAKSSNNIEESAVRQWLEGRSSDKEHIRAARKRLEEVLKPTDPTKFESFPALQIVLLDEKLSYEVMRDEDTKALALPYWQARAVVDSIPPLPKEKETPLTLLRASYLKVKAAQARLDQRIALLRCVEALRMYAAEHDGKLPAKLEDIRLPLSVDPATGKPFTYKVEGNKVQLYGGFLSIQVRYEITFTK
ncbi:MAG: hypothetical protein ACYC3I_16315 [Gemmataceae bacterium]